MLLIYYRWYDIGMKMKVSVSLADDDVAFLDNYARERGLDSRSAALQRAVRLLRTGELAASYEGAWDEWASDPDSRGWEATSEDGLRRDPAR